jgi:ankyrin repeat protein
MQNPVALGKFGRLPLHVACKTNDTTTVEQLLLVPAAVEKINERTDHGFTALYVASQFGFSKLVSALVSNGADLHVSDNGGLSPMHIAARNGHLEVVQVLLELGGNPNQLDSIQWSPLHWAFKSGASNVVELMSQHVTDEIKADAFQKWKK